jgi:hypothetical protein
MSTNYRPLQKYIQTDLAFKTRSNTSEIIKSAKHYIMYDS